MPSNGMTSAWSHHTHWPLFKKPWCLCFTLELLKMSLNVRPFTLISVYKPLRLYIAHWVKHGPFWTWSWDQAIRRHCSLPRQACTSAFATKDRLRSHMIRHEGKVTCNICGKMLSAAYITSHLKTHGQTNFNNSCNKGTCAVFSISSIE